MVKPYLKFKLPAKLDLQTCYAIDALMKLYIKANKHITKNELTTILDAISTQRLKRYFLDNWYGKLRSQADDSTPKMTKLITSSNSDKNHKGHNGTNKSEKQKQTAGPKVRFNIRNILKIVNETSVDAAIDCFIWPTLKYNLEDDLYVKGLIGDNPDLMEYYDKKMTSYFGFEYTRHCSDSHKSADNDAKPKVTAQIIYDTTEKKEEKSETKIGKEENRRLSSFKAANTRTWILDWNCVTFYDGFFIISAPANGSLYFEQLHVNCPISRRSFNYITKYIKDRLDVVYCTIFARKLIVNDNIRLDNAIQTFAKKARQKRIKNEGANRQSSIKVKEVIPFRQALSRAKQMNPEDYRKYKSKFIDFLVELQHHDYNIIPCNERLAHTSNVFDDFEDAFMFTSFSWKNNVLIVYENVNPDRSTLLFIVPKDQYMKAAQAIYDYLQSAENNKRSSIRSREVKAERGLILSYKSINHDDFYSWKSNIKNFRNNH